MHSGRLRRVEFREQHSCPFCRDPLGYEQALGLCPSCLTLYHDGCALEASGCPTPGCRLGMLASLPPLDTPLELTPRALPVTAVPAPPPLASAPARHARRLRAWILTGCFFLLYTALALTTHARVDAEPARTLLTLAVVGVGGATCALVATQLLAHAPARRRAKRLSPSSPR